MGAEVHMREVDVAHQLVNVKAVRHRRLLDLPTRGGLSGEVGNVEALGRKLRPVCGAKILTLRLFVSRLHWNICSKWLRVCLDKT